MIKLKLTERRRGRPAGDGADTEARHRYPADRRRHLENKLLLTTNKDNVKAEDDHERLCLTFFCMDLSL